jgi:glycosyltransferase involved in cell wall biosynthesis
LINENKDLIQSGQADFPEPGIEILDIGRKAHVGVLMSHPTLHAEGCSNSIMEYMACGLPVICSDSGGNRELVIEGETGFIIPPGNADMLAEKLVCLRQHPQQAQAMGERGRQRILNDFSVEKMVSKTIEVYQEVLPDWKP